MSKLKKLLHSACEFLILSRCPGCDCITKYSGTLCPQCQDKYDKEKGFVCPFCEMNAEKCFCTTDKLTVSKDFNTSFASLLYYGNDLPTVKNLIFSLKRNSDKNCEKFFVNELSEFILCYFEKHGINKDDYILTYPPRTKQSIRHFGFDHMKSLCKKTARKTDMAFETVFINKGAGIQKKLSHSEREINAKKSLYLLPTAKVKGKKYIIIDDVITSGATLSRCESLLKRRGASSYFAITLTRTGKLMSAEQLLQRKQFRKI